MRTQELISRQGACSEKDEEIWERNSVNSPALLRELTREAESWDRIIVGPYLFGLSLAAARICPPKTLLVPCLHDEGFARTRTVARLFRSVGGIIFNSEPERTLAERLYGPAIAPGAVVGMGLEQFTADDSAFARRRKLAAPYLMYAGRREMGKGIPLLLDYLELFRARTRRDIKLVLSGSGPVEPSAVLRPHLLDAGFLPEQEKREAMAGALAFCHPSVNESFGIVLLESWLAQTPGLVHAGCAVTRYHCSRSGGGLWFGAYPEFEEALLRLTDNHGLARAMGAAGCRYVLREYNPAAVDARLRQALALPWERTP